VKQAVRLTFSMEIETSDPSPEGVDAAITDIDAQISGQLREIRVKVDGAWVHVDYQVVHAHGVEVEKTQ
jgi:hypothetical protein